MVDDGAMIRVQIEGFGESLFMLVDTGAAISVLDPRFESKLGKPNNAVLVDTPISRDIPAKLFTGPRIRLGGMEALMGPVALSDLRMARFVSGEQCDGILGMSFLTNFVVTLDFKDNIIEFGKTTLQSHSNANWIPIALRPDGRCAVEANIDGANLSFIVDTGNSSAVSLSSEDWAKVFPTAATERGGFNAAIGGTLYTADPGGLGH